MNIPNHLDIGLGFAMALFLIEIGFTVEDAIPFLVLLTFIGLIQEENAS